MSTTVTILSEAGAHSPDSFRAVAGDHQGVGATIGQALDALTAQLDQQNGVTLVVVQPASPDRYFTAEQQARLTELMTRWRAARDEAAPWTPAEQAELDALVDLELRAAARRAEDYIRRLES